MCLIEVLMVTRAADLSTDASVESTVAARVATRR